MNIVVTRWSPLNIDRARGAWKCPRQHIFYGFLDCHFIFSKNFSLLVCGDWRRGAISTSDCVIWCRYCKHLCLVKWADGFFFILDRKWVREFPVIHFDTRHIMTTLDILCRILSDDVIFLSVTDVIILITEDDVILSITEDDVILSITEDEVILSITEDDGSRF